MSRYDRDVASKQAYLKDLKTGKTRLSWAEWLKARQGSPSTQVTRQRQGLSSSDAKAISKFFK